MLFILLTFLSIFYFVLGLFLMNNVELRGIFKKSSYTDVSIMRLLGSFGAAQGLSTLVISILFILFHYEGDVNLLVIGLVTSAIVAVGCLIRYLAKKDKFYVNLMSRLFAWSATGVILYLVYR